MRASAQEQVTCAKYPSPRGMERPTCLTDDVTGPATAGNVFKEDPVSTTASTRAQEIGFAFPLLPGKSETDRDAMLSCWHGDRHDDYVASRQRLGITRESVWMQPTPAGDVVVVHLEARDIDGALHGMATSEEPFDRWFREHVKDVHGVDVAEPLPPLEQILDFRR